MKVRFVGFVLGVVLAVLSVIPAHADRRVALVIGNAGYKNVSPLPNTLNDANAVAKLFRSVGFDIVQLQINLGILEFKRAVRDFLNTAQDADIAVVYYAGHGIEFGGANYMIPVDATLARDYDVEDEAVALDRVIWALQSVRRLRLIIIDACRDNPFVGKMQRSVSIRAASVGLAKVETGFTDTLVAFAAKGGSVSFDGTGPNSPFTTALVKHLGEPGLDIRIALGRVRDEVLRATDNRQEPFVYGSLGGSTVALVPAQETPKVAAPAPAPSAVSPERQLQQNYEFAERIGTREAWESFLANYGTGFYADLARAQLEKLGRARLAAGTAGTPPVPPVPPVLAKTPEPAPAPKPAAPKEQQVAKLDPPPREVPPRPVAPPVQSNAPVLKEAACKHEAAELARLRANPVPDELIRFERDLVCDSLRSQVQRLRESVTPNTTVAAPQASKSAAAAAAAAALPATAPAVAAVAPPPAASTPPAGRQEPAREKPQEVAKLAPPPPARDAPPKPAPAIAPVVAPLVPPAAMEAACRAEGERLTKMRAEPNYDELVKFERELVCDRLKPQVQRLRESLMPGAAAVLPPPAAPPPAVAPPPAIAMPAPPAPAPAPVPPPNAGTTVTAGGSMAACGRDGERLGRLRANPSRDALATFERELSCDQLRPQLQRLKESLVD